MIDAKVKFLELSRDDQKASVETIIFSSEEPVSLDELHGMLINQKSAKLFDESDETTENTDLIDNAKEYIEELIEEINEELQTSGRPYEIVDFAGGYQFCTRNEYGSLMADLVKSRSKRRLSQASLEALAIIAYRQPITKPEIEKIRGVNSNEIVNSLIEKNLIKSSGRRDTLGKPLLFVTTNEFLRIFGLKSLDELPKLREIEEIAEADIITSGKDDITITVDIGSDSPSEIIENDEEKIIKNENQSDS